MHRGHPSPAQIPTLGWARQPCKTWRRLDQIQFPPRSPRAGLELLRETRPASP